MTLIEKIIAKNVGQDTVQPGEIVITRPDRLMIHDIFVPFVADKFKQMGFDAIQNPDSVVLIYDHLVPAAVEDDVRHFKTGDVFAAEYGITNVHRADGICHQLMVEQGYVRPGDVAFGTDSHTTTYGAVGAFSSGIGYTEMAAALGTGELWVKVPQTIRIDVDGELPAHVYAKDIILRVLGDLGAAGATYRCLEFGGTACDNMSLASRMTIANMAVEAGAKCAVFAGDATSLTFAKTSKVPLEELHPDPDAGYVQHLSYKAEDMEPVAACPSQVDKIKPVRELKGTKLDQVFIGSCTNGRLEDLQVAADILRGKQVAPWLRLIVTPASREVYGEAAEQGILTDLIQAGATVTLPGCGLCCGRGGGVVTDGETVLATNNRNFIGRMGSASAGIYLCSPAVAATSALAGEIRLPE